MTLYKYVLHHPRNTLPKHFLETIGAYVSLVNRCDYCVDHHFAGLSRLLGDDDDPGNWSHRQVPRYAAVESAL